MASPLSSQKRRNERNKRSYSTNRMRMTISLILLMLVLVLRVFLFARNKSTKDKDERNELINIVELQDDTKWTITEMWKMLGCDELFEKERPVPSQASWNKMRSVYQKIVGKDSSIQTDNTQDGSHFPVKAKQAPPKGRGIFAVKDIPAGELLWSSTKIARFRDGPSYRNFLFNIEKEHACDVIQWGKPK